MKAILSFIAATILYVALGVFAWKVVCGNMDVDWMSYTMSDLAMFKMTAYSVVTAIITTIGVFIKGKVNEEKWYLLLGMLMAVFFNWGLGAMTEEPHRIFQLLSPFISIAYNIINVVLIYIIIRLNLPED